jgi:protein-tyrosine phosphatase
MVWEAQSGNGEINCVTIDTFHITEPYLNTPMDLRPSSLTSPYNVVDIAHFNNGITMGRLSVSIAPGKKDTRWNRDLDTDLAAIKANGVQVIVCLLEWSEMAKLDIAEYPRRAQEMGFIFLHLPIKDRRAPNQGNITALVPNIVQYLSSGRAVLVHCRGGLGLAVCPTMATR